MQIKCNETKENTIVGKLEFFLLYLFTFFFWYKSTLQLPLKKLFIIKFLVTQQHFQIYIVIYSNNQTYALQQNNTLVHYYVIINLIKMHVGTPLPSQVYEYVKLTVMLFSRENNNIYYKNYTNFINKQTRCQTSKVINLYKATVSEWPDS